MTLPQQEEAETRAQETAEGTGNPKLDEVLAGTMNDRIGHLIELDNELRAMEDKEKVLKAERKIVEAALLKEFAADGIQNQKMKGRLVYLHRTPYADVKDGRTKEEIITALDELGLGEIARRTITTTQISALVKEYDQDGEGQLPDELAQLIDVGERYSIRTKRG